MSKPTDTWGTKSAKEAVAFIQLISVSTVGKGQRPQLYRLDPDTREKRYHT